MPTIHVAELLTDGHRYEAVLYDHLRHNLYPPCPELVGQAAEAVAAVVGGQRDALVRLSNGVDVTAQVVVDGLHLGAFVEHRPTDL
jgi:hypothetical protein